MKSIHHMPCFIESPAFFGQGKSASSWSHRWRPQRCRWPCWAWWHRGWFPMPLQWGSCRSITRKCLASCQRWRERGSYRMSVPSSTSNLEPREMSAERCRAEDGIRILFEFLVGNSLLDRNLRAHVSKGSLETRIKTYGIILCVDGKEGDPDPENGVHTRGVTVVGCLCGIAPCCGPWNIF